MLRTADFDPPNLENDSVSLAGNSAELRVWKIRDVALPSGLFSKIRE
jgi:hypothetical protein